MTFAPGAVGAAAETAFLAIARDQVLLEDPDLYTRDPDAFERLMEAIGQAQEDKTMAELRWLELAEMVEGQG